LEKTFFSRLGEAHVAVKDFDLDILRGEFICLLGASGCGKTTVLNMVAGFERPTAGVLELNGKSIVGPGRDRGVVFQSDDSLFNWLTALQNVEFGLRMQNVSKKERRDRAMHYLDLVGLARQKDKYPSELSGGMKQRIQIARVLANEPEMLLMDEPFGALDAQTRALMQEQLARIWQSTRISVLFITHDIDEAIILSSRIGVMKAGPASNIKGIVEVDLPDKRNRTDHAFMRYYRVVHDMIREEVLKSVHAVEDAEDSPS
jgi:NitT/TauT family transport system ATP-binding protein